MVFSNEILIILDIIHRPVLYLERDVSEIGVSQSSGGTYSIGPNRASLCLWTPAGFIEPMQNKPLMRVNTFYTVNLYTCEA
jgi:hypothetical protein